jgi:hypothetical protein
LVAVFFGGTVNETSFSCVLPMCFEQFIAWSRNSTLPE